VSAPGATRHNREGITLTWSRSVARSGASFVGIHRAMQPASGFGCVRWITSMYPSSGVSTSSARSTALYVVMVGPAEAVAAAAPTPAPAPPATPMFSVPAPPLRGCCTTSATAVAAANSSSSRWRSISSSYSASVT
jgi:hypothetical protein